MKRILVAILCVLGAFVVEAADRNLAAPAKHSYANPAGGRENYRLSNETVNEARLYDFYQRQADFYMASPGEVPKVIPAYPGLDAGKHGHWGKHNQNNHQDGRWNDIDHGDVKTTVFKPKGASILKGICVRLGDERQLSACFDPMSLTYRALWQGGFLKFEPFRWGTSRNVTPIGDAWFTIAKAEMPEDSAYLGFRRYGKRIVFEYGIANVEVADEPWATADAFYRRLDLKQGSSHFEISFPTGDGLKLAVVSKRKVRQAAAKNGSLTLIGAKAGASVVVRVSKSDQPAGEKAALRHLNAPRKPERRWQDILKVPGTLGESRKDSAYIVDTLNVPYDNPYKTVMQMTGVGFLPTGDALVCTLAGDIWRVSGIDQDLKNVTWQRYASGFNQPVGIHIDQDGIFVLDRGQIYRLHDTNNDGEADYYENWANDFGGYDRSHSHTFGLHRLADGSFNFTQRESILRTGADRLTTLQGWGVRNCMGIGGSDDYFWVAPQEGTWTPASAIIEVNNGEFYGLPTKDGKAGTIATPLCYIPRGIDNSTGGMLEMTSDKWGPFQGAHVGLSYGASRHYLILRDDQGDRPQGAVVPLEGEFLSGSMRGAFHPQDEQLYLVGMDGWGDYSVKDGCFHRVRYTGKPVYKPNGFRIHANGIRINFTTKLDTAQATELERYFAQAWNYEYAKRYGSPEFSAKDPKSLGHDPIPVRSVKLLADNSIFVEMPAMEPVMQLHLRMHLRAADGHEFKTDLFASPMYPGEHFTAKGLAKPRTDKPTAIALRVVVPEKEQEGSNTTGKVLEGAREIIVDAVAGLQYAQKLIEVKADEPLAWKLRNTDVMPHNLVLVKPNGAKTVGMASFKMMSDPTAGKKHYIPDLPEVLAFIPVINPSKEHTLYLRAPKAPGDYPYICTFPGHWMAMRGVLKVR
jgi:azurin